MCGLRHLTNILLPLELSVPDNNSLVGRAYTHEKTKKGDTMFQRYRLITTTLSLTTKEIQMLYAIVAMDDVQKHFMDADSSLYDEDTFVRLFELIQRHNTKVKEK